MAEAQDLTIIRQALLEDRIVITLDADFHTLLALSQSRKPSVIRIRIEGLKALEFCDLIQRVLLQGEDDLIAGSLISVNEVQIRVRKLPVT